VRGAIVGDGDQRRSLHRHATRRSLGQRVSWHGSLPHADRLFRAFDALVLSSRTEGTPMVVFEAMAAGVPLIATNVGGVPDALPVGTALLVPPESPHELGAAIRAVFLERAAAAARARFAYARLHQAYGVSAWVTRYDTIYRSAAKNASR
jgi:glycosyltransferase involved in cell wall biosynthesis